MNKSLSNLTTFFLILCLIILLIVLYKNKERFIGTREWNRTRNMSYDIRGEPIIPYYPIGVFNQPEVPYRYRYGHRYGYPNRFAYPNRYHNMYLNPYYPEDYLGYTYDYVNPYQGMIPPIFASPYSVPYETSNVNK